VTEEDDSRQVDRPVENRAALELEEKKQVKEKARKGG
jgi:hypothetical protein